MTHVSYDTLTRNTKTGSRYRGPLDDPSPLPTSGHLLSSVKTDHVSYDTLTHNAKTGSKYSVLLEDPDVIRWYRHLAKGAVATADNYLRTLGLALERTGQTMKGLLALSDKDLGDWLEDYVNANETTPGSARTVMKAARSWLNRFDRKIERRIKVSRTHEGKRTKVAFIPTPEQLGKILLAADVRTRAAISLLAFSGQRPEVLGKQLDLDKTMEGLRLRDIVDLTIDGGAVGFTKIPARFIVRREVSKQDFEYFSFLGPEACGYVLAYLNERVAAGEVLTEKTPFLVPAQPDRALALRILSDRKQDAGRKLTPEERNTVLTDAALRANWRGKEAANGGVFIPTRNGSDMIREPLRLAGVERMDRNAPYIWRDYFQAHAELAQGLSLEYRDFFVGHKGEIEAVYSKHKQLPENKIEAMRNAYSLALPFIETVATGQQGSTDAAKELLGDMRAMLVGWLTSLGLPKEEAELVGPANAVALTEKALAAQERGMQGYAAELMSKVAAARDAGKAELAAIAETVRSAAPQAIVTVKTPNGGSVMTELRELIAWRRDGLLTDVEFVDAKRRLLEVAWRCRRPAPAAARR